MMKYQKIKIYWQSLGIVLILDFILELVLKGLRIINTVLLLKAEVPITSLVNVKRIIDTHPLVAGSIVVELLLLWLFLIIMLAALMIGLVTIVNGQSWHQSWYQLRRAVQQIRFKTMLIFLVDFIVLTPIFSVAFRTPLLTMIRIPEFILDYGTRKWWLCVLTLIIYMISWPIAVRNLYIWSLVNISGQPINQACVQSKQLTRNGKWQGTTCRLGAVLVSAGLVSWTANSLLYGIQYWFQPNNQWFSTISLVIAEIVALMLCTWTLMEWTVQVTHVNDHQIARPRINGWTAVALIIMIFSAGMMSKQYFARQSLKMPMTVSHRGVTDGNGVQNSISALKRTSRKYHPDYVEMDIHETKDHQFVVMHDEKLRKLAGVNKRPGQLTLRQLERLSIHENGQRSKIASLNEYLSAAGAIHQKLIIELKTTQYDSPDAIQRFNRQYGQLIVHRHYIVHSLDYNAVHQLHRLNPQMKVLYLQAYNFTNPVSQVSGFNNEYSTLNSRFINAAHHHHQLVYAWTVNNRGAMRQLYNQQVDGIVTDHLAELQTTLRQVNHQQNRARRFWNYLNPIANLPNN